VARQHLFSKKLPEQYAEGVHVDSLQGPVARSRVGSCCWETVDSFEIDKCPNPTKGAP
jgi:hypothetical protein